MRYFQHIIGKDGVITDREGAEYVDLADALEDARSGIRNLAAADLASGRDIDIRRIEIRDPFGKVCAQVSLAEILANIVPFSEKLFFANIAVHVGEQISQGNL